MIRTTIGEVPSSIFKSGSLRIPHSTEVGQSGPPTSTHMAPKLAAIARRAWGGKLLESVSQRIWHRAAARIGGV